MRDSIKTSDARAFVRGYLPLLTAKQEKTMFQAWWDTNPAGFKAFMDPENKEVTKFTGGNDNLYLTRIILAYSPAIRRAMKELANYRIDEEELLSEGLIALAEAARRYAPSEHDDVRFAAYAKICVKGMMQGYIMRNFFMIQFCTNHSKKRLFYSMRKLIAIELQNKGSFRMTKEVIRKLAVDHNLDESDVALMYEMFQKPYESLDQPVRGSVFDQEPTLLGETLEDHEASADEAVFQENEVKFHRTLVIEAMQVLTHREKTVFVAQVLMEKERQRTLDDLGLEFSVSKERIRQVRIEAMEKMNVELHRLVNEKGLSRYDIFQD
jgi:RNA polymerase sigma-32 factor